jgi:dTDP-4-dehydrorhamnose 3,5-epimerase
MLRLRRVNRRGRRSLHELRARIGAPVDVIETSIPAVKLLRPSRHVDPRGLFAETFSARALTAIGITTTFVQDNHSISLRVGTVRGLHFQTPPHAQAKLVRVVRGAILDVAVDLRDGSPTFGRHVAAELTAANWIMMFVPEGFAHGFCTLAPDTEVVYKVSSYYEPAHDHGVRWNDPALDIDWPVREEAAILSAKDRGLPLLAALPRWFTSETAHARNDPATRVAHAG